MEDELSSPEELNEKLKLFEDDIDRIDFLEKYIRNSSDIPLDLLASIYESLGSLHIQTGKPKGTFYQKAGSTWEMISVLKDGSKNVSVSKRNALKHAVKDYKKAYSIYKENNYLTGLSEAEDKIGEVKNELRNYGSPVRTISITVVIALFILSFFLISPQLTGYVTTADTGDASIIGFVLVILGIVGVFFILKRWR